MQAYILFLCIAAASACLGPFLGPQQTTTTTTTTVAPPLTSCRCGRANKVHKIVGGVDTTQNEYPWQAGLLEYSRPGTPFCGGTLISDREVLTAAHCTVGGSARYVVLGEHNVKDNNDGQKVVRVCNVKEHEGYNTQTLDKDFSMLTLCESVQFTKAIQPACLPANSANSYSGRDAVVSGWGTLSSGGSQPSILQEVTVKTMSSQQCRTTAYGNEITNNMICASNPGRDSCQGDSGGPLVTDEGSSYTLIGVVSWGNGCAQRGYPGVYASVTSQLNWIKTSMSGQICQRAQDVETANVQNVDPAPATAPAATATAPAATAPAATAAATTPGVFTTTLDATESIVPTVAALEDIITETV